MAAAQSAMDLDDDLGAAHASMAMARQYAWNWAGAESEYRKAIALDPTYAAAW